MNKTERIAVVVLFGLLMAWSFYGKRLLPPAPPAVPAEAVPVPATGELKTLDALTPPSESATASAAVASSPVDNAAAIVRQSEETQVDLTNGVMRLSFTSWGGGIASASLSGYSATVEDDSGPVKFDFSDRVSLSYSGLPGLSAEDDFLVQATPDQRGVIISRTAENGLSLTRTIVMEEHYALTVEDRFLNSGPEPLTFADVKLQSGPMRNLEAGPAQRGMVSIGVDVLLKTDDKVDHVGKKLSGLFGVRGGCSRPDLHGVPLFADELVDAGMKWVAVKNKFFVQILEPMEETVLSARIRAGRKDSTDAFDLESASALLVLPVMTLSPGETMTRRIRYYVGPKKYSQLKAEGGRRTEIMEFGRFFKPVCKVLLPLLNGIEKVVPGGYGMAIILLTIIVKLVFWPVTHKGTESMKRMQKLQPEIKKLRDKYKSDPKKLQEKQMLLYREHKVNPLAGCLPMLIQIPVFIALFTVLRSAVELRYTSFLWIRDLSAPEGLMAGTIPYLAGGINILPLLMTATMVLQQRLTPSVGDPQQQKMMAFMPVMMLFIFYNMPSALVLYWTVSQLLSILQLVLQQRKDRLSAAPALA